MIEAVLERIAVALEKLAGNAPMPTNVATGAPAADTEPRRGPGRPAAPKQPDKPATAPTPPAPAAALEGQPAQPANNEQQAAPAAPKQAAEVAAESVYKDLANTANKIVEADPKEGRGKVIAVFESFGVRSGKELTPAQWPDALLKLKAVLKDVTTPGELV